MILLHEKSPERCYFLCIQMGRREFPGRCDWACGPQPRTKMYGEVQRVLKKAMSWGLDIQKSSYAPYFIIIFPGVASRHYTCNVYIYIYIYISIDIHLHIGHIHIYIYMHIYT